MLIDFSTLEEIGKPPFPACFKSSQTTLEVHLSCLIDKCPTNVNIVWPQLNT